MLITMNRDIGIDGWKTFGPSKTIYFLTLISSVFLVAYFLKVYQ